jgi:hypothetical protein
MLQFLSCSPSFSSRSSSSFLVLHLNNPIRILARQTFDSGFSRADDNLEPMKICASLSGGIALVVAMMADTSPLETPDKGSPLRRAILDGLRASKVMQELSQAWHAKIIFTDAHIRRSGDWAWVAASPMSEKDSSQKTESFTAVMRESRGQWALVEFVPDSIPSAEDPEKEFRNWRTEFMKKHPECPAAIFPPKF